MHKKMPDGSTIPTAANSCGCPVDEAEKIVALLRTDAGWATQFAAPIEAAIAYARRQGKTHVMLSVTWHSLA